MKARLHHKNSSTGQQATVFVTAATNHLPSHKNTKASQNKSTPVPVGWIGFSTKARHFPTSTNQEKPTPSAKLRLLQQTPQPPHSTHTLRTFRAINFSLTSGNAGLDQPSNSKYQQLQFPTEPLSKTARHTNTASSKVESSAK